MFLFGGLDHLGDQADLRVHPGGADDAPPAPVGDHRAHECRVQPIAERDFPIRRIQYDPRVLLDRLRLAGQRRFLDLEVDALDQTQIGRDEVAGLQQHQVANNEFAPGNRHPPPVANYLRIRRRHLLQRR